jgi:hypothetical protein
LQCFCFLCTLLTPAFRAVHQQADLRAATALEEEEKQHAAAKLKLVQAITAAKVGKDIPLVPAPHM